MSDGIKYFLIFAEGLDDCGAVKLFSFTYEGKRIIWEYLFDTIKEENSLINLRFNGFTEITHEEYLIKNRKK